MPPRYAMRSASTPQITEEAESVHWVCSNTVHPGSVCPNITKSKPSCHRQGWESASRLLGHYSVMHPGSVCAGFHSNPQATDQADNVLPWRRRFMPWWSEWYKQVESCTCWLQHANLPLDICRDSSHELTLLLLAQLINRSSQQQCLSLVSCRCGAGRIRCRMTVKSMFSEGVSAALEEHKSEAVHCCLNERK